MTVNMCSISDRAHWKFYLFLTDGRTLPTITQHMAKICPFLESKDGTFLVICQGLTLIWQLERTPPPQ